LGHLLKYLYKAELSNGHNDHLSTSEYQQIVIAGSNNKEGARSYIDFSKKIIYIIFLFFVVLVIVVLTFSIVYDISSRLFSAKYT